MGRSPTIINRYSLIKQLRTRWLARRFRIPDQNEQEGRDPLARRFKVAAVAGGDHFATSLTTRLNALRQPVRSFVEARRCSAVDGMKKFVRLLPLVLVLATTACNADTLVAPPTAICAESGQQCELPKGPLGVCERRRCEAAEAGPCFECVSQH